jgi:hypothetical protein
MIKGVESYHMTTEWEVLGTVLPDGSLHQDQKLKVPPGRVKVRVELMPSSTPTAESLGDFIDRTRREMAASGSHFMNEAEVTAWIDELREDSIGFPLSLSGHGLQATVE